MTPEEKLKGFEKYLTMIIVNRTNLMPSEAEEVSDEIIKELIKCTDLFLKEKEKETEQKLKDAEMVKGVDPIYWKWSKQVFSSLRKTLKEAGK